MSKPSPILNEATGWRQNWLPAISLFTSTSTLLCCALPALLVTLGLGASLAGLISIAPWLTVVSQYKISLFAVSGFVLITASIISWQTRKQPCPADPDQARTCQRLRKINWVVLSFAVIIYLTGFFFAFLATYII